MIKIAENLKGKKVLVRSYGAGVYFGTLDDMEGDTVRMSNVRNIWHWTGASCLSQIVNDGITGDKVSCVVSSMVLTKVCQVMPLTHVAINNLERQPVWIY
jgi:hypothetical protein